MNRIHDVLIILTAAACTFMTRLFPFALFRKTHALPPAVRYLGQVLPASVIAVLIVYCLKGVTFIKPAGYIPALVSVILVAVLHKWKRNLLLSVGLGTLCYMILLRLL